MKYYAPISTEQVKNSLAHRPFPLIAAGMTDIGLWVTKAGKELANIVSILSHACYAISTKSVYM